MENFIKELGFNSVGEFNNLMANAEIDTPDKMAAFLDWKENDGTKEGLLKLQPKPDEIEIVNDREKQDELISSLIEFLDGWVSDNPDIRKSVVDSINYNIAYVEVFWFNEILCDQHEDIFSEGRKVSSPMNFEEAFKTLQSSFDNIIFNQ